jgi:hypothetical protein
MHRQRKTIQRRKQIKEERREAERDEHILRNKEKGDKIRNNRSMQMKKEDMKD